MEKEGQQADKNGLLDLNDPIPLPWNNDEDAIDELYGDEDHAHTDPEDEDYVPNGCSKPPKKRVKRHTPQQIQELMAVYDQCTHPDPEAMQALGAMIGLEPKHVKFWFQNRRSQVKKKDQQEQNQQMQQVNASLKAENWSLRKAILTQTCVTCCGKTLPFNPLLEKQHLLTKNAELKDKFLRVSAIQSKIIRDSAFTQPAPWISSRSSEVNREALLHYTKASMEQFLVLATKGEPSFQKTMGELMWLPAADGGEVLNFVEYRAKFSQALFGLRPEGFAVEATRDAAIVWGSAAELVSIFMDTARWSETFPGVVASVVAGDVVSTGSFTDGQIQLMNAEMWVQSPCVPNRTVNILRYSKLVAERKWAVMDVSVDGIFGQEVLLAYLPARYMGCRLLPSGCLIEDMSNGYCKVTWIVHAEYDETTMPTTFRPLFLNGQAMGARRWLASLQMQREYAAALYSSLHPGNNNAAKAVGMLKLAQQMMASFYAAVSGPIAPTQATTSINDWFGSVGTGIERFDAAVRMVTWEKPGSSMAGEPASCFLSATTTLWLPCTPPEHVFNYLRNKKRRGEWDFVLANGAAVKELGSVSMGCHLAGNVISILSSMTDGTNDRVLILQEVRTEASGSLVVYTPIGEGAMDAAMGGDSGGASNFPTPSGFAILPDGRGKTRHAPCPAPSTSSSDPILRNDTGGSLVTMAYRVQLPGSPPDTAGAFDDVGKLICHVMEKIKIAVEAEIVLPA